MQTWDTSIASAVTVSITSGGGSSSTSFSYSFSNGYLSTISSTGSFLAPEPNLPAGGSQPGFSVWFTYAMGNPLAGKPGTRYKVTYVRDLKKLAELREKVWEEWMSGIPARLRPLIEAMIDGRGIDRDKIADAIIALYRLEYEATKKKIEEAKEKIDQATGGAAGAGGAGAGIGSIPWAEIGGGLVELLVPPGVRVLVGSLLGALPTSLDSNSNIILKTKLLPAFDEIATELAERGVIISGSEASGKSYWSDGLVFTRDLEGNIHVWYADSGWVWNELVHVGILDPQTMMVRRGANQVTLAQIEHEVEGWGTTTGDWDEWFEEHAWDFAARTIVNLIAEEIDPDYRDTVILAGNTMAALAEQGVEWTVTGAPAIKTAASVKAAAAAIGGATSGRAAVSGVRRFRSFSELKRKLGPAGEGKVWHHIVEQRKPLVAKFGAEAIHSTENVVSVSREVNQAIANYYSRIRPFTGGKTVRKWLETQSFAKQTKFGRRILDLAQRARRLP